MEYFIRQQYPGVNIIFLNIHAIFLEVLLFTKFWQNLEEDIINRLGPVFRDFALQNTLKNKNKISRASCASQFLLEVSIFTKLAPNDFWGDY